MPGRKYLENFNKIYIEMTGNNEQHLEGKKNI